MKHEIQHLDSISRLAAATHESANPKYELDAEIGFNKTSDWRSIYVASFLGFCTALQLALFNSSIWSYLSTIDNTATEQFFGYMVSAFSVGEMIGSPLAGYFSNRFHRVSHILYVGIVFLFAGNIIYSCAETDPSTANVDTGTRNPVIRGFLPSRAPHNFICGAQIDSSIDSSQPTNQAE
ncbi:major facilitator superfamily domain-containing protein [Ditylenchus destructor]|uniref:Major facilitator superfamily domain-containing protein n=1 Tax=Ditylenchus destructor TaxID=166010 RepID=A0AAD4NG14_9BILA|nr:major facilitator superfamily domain-containing protein [Ditylenchus destructor]